MTGSAFNDRLDEAIALVVKTMRENGQSRSVTEFIVAELRELRAPTPDRSRNGEKPQALSAKHESGLPEGSSD